MSQEIINKVIISLIMVSFAYDSAVTLLETC